VVHLGRFELLEHTADVGLVAYGADLSDAFAAAAEGLFSIIADLTTVKETISYRVEVTASDIESLLVEWLNELLFLFDTQNVLLRRFEVQVMPPTHLVGQAWGERYDPARHRLNLGVKAATYHGIWVQSNGEVRLQVILDV